MQGRVFFHRAAVVLRGGGRNAAQVTTGQRWLEQAPSIGTGTIAAHNGVQFIDKQHHPGIGIADLRQHGPQPFLELPPELGTGDEGPHIKSHQPQTLQGFRHLSGHNPLRQQFGDRGFAHTRSTDQHRVVLPPARKHLDQAPDLGVAADHRIELAFGCRCREITAVELKR